MLLFVFIFFIFREFHFILLINQYLQSIFMSYLQDLYFLKFLADLGYHHDRNYFLILHLQIHLINHAQ